MAYIGPEIRHLVWRPYRVSGFAFLKELRVPGFGSFWVQLFSFGLIYMYIYICIYIYIYIYIGDTGLRGFTVSFMRFRVRF